jgi:hypothetical protein
MTIYSPNTEETFDKVELYLTFEEAEEFEGRLSSYCKIDWKDSSDAGNVFGAEDGFDVIPAYTEFVIYTENNFDSLGYKSKRIILHDK